MFFQKGIKTFQGQICNTLFILLSVFAGLPVYGVDTVWGELSKDVILPCLFPPGEDEVIHWQLGEISNQIVHSYYNGKDMLEMQDEKYKGRTTLFTSELSKGNASLQIRNLQKSDENSYYCYVGTNTGKVEFSVQLRVAGVDIVWGELSKDVILPCLFPPGEDEVIHWQLREISNQIVHSYYNGKVMLEEQDEKYKGRTTLFTSELSKGNASLQIQNLQKSDENSYYCYVGTNTGKVEFSVQLRVAGVDIVWGELSKDVILPCLFPPGEDEVIHWQLREISNQRVHSYYNGKDMLEMQDEKYKGRTTLFTSELSKGNASLQIRNLQKSDENSYNCYVGTNTGKVEFSVQLRVAAFENPSIKYEVKNKIRQLTCTVENAYPTDAVRIMWPTCNTPDTPSSASIIQIPRTANTCQCLIHHSKLNINWRGAWEKNEINSTEQHFKFVCNLNETLYTSFLITWSFRNSSLQTELASMNSSLTPAQINANYTERIHVSMGEQSLQLKDLKTEDSGEYVCMIRSAQGMFINVTSLNLYITEESRSFRSHLPLIGALPLLFVLLTLCALLIFYMVRWRKSSQP